MEVLIRHLVWKIFSKRIRKTPCLLEIPVMIRILQQKIISTQCLRLLRLLRPQKNKLSQHSGGLRKESAHKTQVRSNRRTGQGQGKLVESLSFIIGLFFLWNRRPTECTKAACCKGQLGLAGQGRICTIK